MHLVKITCYSRFDRINKKFQGRNAFFPSCFNVLVPTVLSSFKNIYLYKRLKISIWNRRIIYWVVQCILGFLDNDWFSMNTYMTCNPCQTGMLTDNNDTFFYFNYLYSKIVGNVATLGGQLTSNSPSAKSEKSLY
jgi:hypothetical protein